MKLCRQVSSSKQSRRHSRLLMIDPKLGSLTYSQSQKHSLLPPVVRPHIGSFSNLGLGAGNKVLPIKLAASWPVRAVSATNIITASWGIPSVPCLSQSSFSSNIALLSIMTLSPLKEGKPGRHHPGLLQVPDSH